MGNLVLSYGSSKKSEEEKPQPRKNTGMSSNEIRSYVTQLHIRTNF